MVLVWNDQILWCWVIASKYGEEKGGGGGWYTRELVEECVDVVCGVV